MTDALRAGLIILIVVLVILAPILAIGGSISAASFSDDVWQTVGRRRVRWIFQALGVFVLPLALVYSGLYFIRVRPKLQAAEAAAVVAQSRTDWQDVGSPSPGSVITSEGGDLDELRFRHSWPRLWRLALLLPSQAPLLVNVYRHPSPNWLLYFVLALDPVAVTVSVSVLLLGGSALSPSGVRPNTLRRRRIPWSEVGAVTQEFPMGTCRVALWTRAGKRVWMAAPTTRVRRQGQHKFEHDFALIGDYWLHHRGNGPS